MNTQLKTDQLVTDLKRIVNDSEELLESTKETLEDKAHKARNCARNALNTARRTCRRLEKKAADGAKAADRTIRGHPYQSIGIALGAGLLIGALAARASK